MAGTCQNGLIDMKIVQVIYSLDMGGIEEFSLNLASCLAADGFVSTLVILSKGRDEEWCRAKKDSITSAGTDVIEIADYSKFGKLSSLTKVLSKLQPDAVILHHELNTLRIAPARLLRRFKVIQIQHNTKINGVMQHRMLGKFLVDKYVCVSKDVKSVLTDVLNLGDEQSEVIENGIFVDEFSCGQDSDGIIRVLAAGRFTAQKNYVELAGLFRNLLNEGGMEHVHITMAGEGEFLGSVKAILKEHPQVLLPGPVADMKSLYQQTDIYVSYSLYEGFSLTLLEAMASGCAVVCTDTSGSRDIIRNGYNGFLVGVNDSEAFCSALCELIRDHEKREELSAAALESVKDYDFSKTYNRYKILIGSLVENGGK